VRIHERIEAAFEAWGRIVVRHRFSVAGVCLLLSGGVASFVPQLEVDNSTESLLMEGDPAREHYDAFRDQFGQDENLVIAIRPAAVFDIAFLEHLRALHEDIEREVPYVEEVTSLWNARNTRGDGDELVVEDLMETWPATNADVEALRKNVLATPAYRNTLVNPGGTVTTIVIEPFIYSTLGAEDDSLGGFEDVAAAGDPEFLTEGESLQLLVALQEVLGRYSGLGFEVHLSGGYVFDAAMAENLARDVGIFMTLGVLLMSVILFVLFRRVSGVVLPVAMVLLSLGVNYGTMALLGIPTSMSGQVLPVLVLVVGISSAIHILAIVYQRLGRGETREDAIAASLGHSGLAIFMAATTTAAGLLSFSLAGMGQVANLGRAAPIGVMLTFLYSVTLLPALLAIVPLRASRFGGDALQRRLARGLVQVGDIATARPRAVLLVAATLVVLGGFGVAQLRFSQDSMRWFPDEDPIRTAVDFLNAEMGGAGGIEVWVDTGRENALHDPDFMHRFDEAVAFTRGLEADGGQLTVGATLSVLDLVKETHQALNENRSEFYAIPQDRALLAQELLLFENSGPEHLEDFADSQLSMARLSVRTTFADGSVWARFTDRLEAGLREILGDGPEIRITGIGALIGRSFRLLDITMLQSYAIALMVITPLMVLLIGNLRRGLLSMIPNLLPIWLTLGLMGLLGITLDSSTLLLGCVLIGLAVDDTIHFMHKFQRYLAQSGDPRQAVRDTLETTGSALFFTTLVITAGFSTMIFAYMVNARVFGLLASFAAATAFLADLLVAPALMTLATRRQTEDPVSTDATLASGRA